MEYLNIAVLPKALMTSLAIHQITKRTIQLPFYITAPGHGSSSGHIFATAI